MKIESLKRRTCSTIYVCDPLYRWNNQSMPIHFCSALVSEGEREEQEGKIPNVLKCYIIIAYPVKIYTDIKMLLRVTNTAWVCVLYTTNTYLYYTCRRGGRNRG